MVGAVSDHPSATYVDVRLILAIACPKILYAASNK